MDLNQSVADLIRNIQATHPESIIDYPDEEPPVWVTDTSTREGENHVSASSTAAGSTSVPGGDPQLAPGEGSPEGNGKPRITKQDRATWLLNWLRKYEFVLFRDSGDLSWIAIKDGPRRRLFAVESEEFSDWCMERLNQEEKELPDEAVFKRLRAILKIQAKSGATRDVYIRRARHGDTIYLDLANETGQVVEVTAAGWKILADDPPVYFVQTGGMKPLPEPLHWDHKGPDPLDSLRDLLLLHEDDQWAKVLAFLLDSLRGEKPSSALWLSGVEGSAKSTVAYGVRGLLDPHLAWKGGLPPNDREMALYLRDHAILSFDNLRRIPDRMSDTLCRILDGGVIPYRKMWGDYLMIPHGSRPIILNGMDEDVVARTDLLDRTLHIRRRPLPRGTHKDPKVVEAQLEQWKGAHLGRLLDIVAAGLAHYPKTPESGYGRMASLERWMRACSPALGWEPDYFTNLMAEEREDNDIKLLDGWPLFEPLRKVITRDNSWKETGTLSTTVGALCTRVGEYVDANKIRLDYKYREPGQFSNEIRSHESALQRKLEWGIEWPAKRHNKSRMIFRDLTRA
jgi:hypothetical protein